MFRSLTSSLRHPLITAMFAIAAMFVPTSSYAQLVPEPHLAISPAYPKPYETATVSLLTNGAVVAGGSIRWFINGTEIAESANARSLPIEVRGVGETTRVEARFSSDGGVSRAVSLLIVPTTVDIVAEPQNYRPAFYQGKGVPVAGSSVRLVAMAHLSAGSQNPADITYTWRANGATLFGGPRLGQDTATIDLPLAGSVTVTVRAENRDGTQASEEAITLRSSSPIVALYQDDPLYGLAPISLEQGFSSKEEVTLRAEPYFFNEADLASSRTSYTWSLDGQEITNPSAKPNIITLRPSGTATKASIGLSLQKTEGILQLARTSLVLEFTGSDFILR